MANKLDQATIDKLKSEHTDLRKLTLKDGDVVLMRVPSLAEWRRFEEQRTDEKRRVPAAEALIRHAVVFPDAAGLNELLARRPGLLNVLSSKAGEIAGAAEDVAEEKL